MHHFFENKIRESSSVGRAQPCQGWGRGFESRLSLFIFINPVNLISATIDLIPVIQELSDKIWPVTFKNILSPEQIKYMMDMMYSTEALETQIDKLGHKYLLACDGDRYVGYLSYEPHYKGRQWTKIHKIYLLPSLQGKGVGRLFIDEVACFAVQNDDWELSLNVNRNNHAIGFYEKMGFKIIDRENIDIGNGFLMEDYVMNKKLNQKI